LPEIQTDVIFLAPAITYQSFNRLRKDLSDSITNFRMYCMQDSFELEDQVWGQTRDLRRLIYPSSLLYLVSGILESYETERGEIIDEADVPLLGMQRYF